MRIQVDHEQLCYDSYHSNEPYGDWHEYYSSSVTGAKIIGDHDNVSYSSDSFVIPDDSTHVYVVYMIYSSGDSFGNSDGLIDILHAFGSEKYADKLVNTVNKHADDFSIKFKDEFDREISINNPAAGYFESIDSVSVKKFAIR